MNRAIVLLSGGMDSLVTAAIAINENDEIHFLHAEYGQRTMIRERECFDRLCDFYKPKSNKVISLGWFSQIGGSALTDTKMEVSDFSASNTIPSTYVPFRNANLLCAAVSWAEVLEASNIYIGAVEEDSSGYPDCREVFFGAMNEVIKFGTKNTFPIRIVTPVLHKTKAEIVKLGFELGVPFEYSWSCYKELSIACGTCDSCHLRLKAFEIAGQKDPIKYHTR